MHLEGIMSEVDSVLHVNLIENHLTDLKEIHHMVIKLCEKKDLDKDHLVIDQDRTQVTETLEDLLRTQDEEHDAQHDAQLVDMM